MPIYEYQCTNCGEVFEAFQKINDKPLSRCKFCNSPVERLIGHSSFQLKGSGWYLTDYARKQSSGSADSGPKKSGKTEKGAEGSATATSDSTKSD